jgi:tetratricopeptide (TPR) repeat protein
MTRWRLPGLQHFLRSVAVAAILPLLAVAASAQGVKGLEKDVQQCNRLGDAAPELRLNSCTAIIDSGTATRRGLAIAYNNRGNAYNAQGQYDRAIDDYNDSIGADPRYARAYNNRGAAYQRLGDHKRAIQDFDQSIKLDPGSAPVFVNRAESYARLGDHRRALQDLTNAIKIQPDLDNAWNGRCWVRAIAGELRPALADCNESLKLKRTAATLDSRAFAYLKLGQASEALADYNAALQMNPKLATSLYGRGLIKRRTGNAAEAEADIAAAVAISPNIAADFARYGVWR